MAIVYSNNVIEIAVRMTYDTLPTVNVWHMFNDAELAGATKAQVVEDFRNNWQDHIMPRLNGGVALVDFVWRSLDQDDGSVGVVVPAAGKPLVGGQAAAGLAANSALLVHKRTSNRPRGRRDGRCYLPGALEGDVDTRGFVLAASRNTINTALTAFYNGISDSSANWGGDSYPVVLETTPASRTPGATPVVIGSRRVTSLVLDPRIGTQRERMR